MADIIESIFIENSDGLADVSPAARNIQCIKAIIDADPGFKGEKRLARMELAYVYFTLKKEAFANFTAEERDATIRKQVGLKDTWEPSKLVRQAILQLTEPPTAQEKLLIKAEQILDDYLVMFDEISTYLRDAIKIISKEDGTKIKTEDIAIRKAFIDEAKKHFKETTGYVKDLKDTFNLVEELKVQIKEDKKKKNVRKEKLISNLEEDHSLYER